MKRPLVPPTLAFMVGIAAFGATPVHCGYIVLFIIISVVPVVRSFVKSRPFTPYLLVLPFFFLGALYVQPLATRSLPAGHIAEYAGDAGVGGAPLGVRVEGVVASMPEQRGVRGVRGVRGARGARGGDRTRFVLEATRVFSGGDWVPTTGRIMVTLSSSNSGEVGKGEDVRGGVGRGDKVVMLAKLKRPRNFGNPGGFDYERWLAGSGVYVTAYVKEELIVKTSRGTGPMATAGRMRRSVGEFIDSLDLNSGDVLKALVIGEKGGVAPERREVFVRSGTAHLLAISGLHVGFVAYLSYLITLWLLKRSERVMLAVNVRKVAIAASLPPVLLYGAVSGFSVSTERAVIMITVFCCAFLINREKEMYNVIAAAALAVLVLRPAALWEASFQLSFAAVLAIVYLVPGVRAFFDDEEEDIDESVEVTGAKRLRTRVALTFFVTVAAMVGTAPVLAANFNAISIVSPLTNLVAVPLVGTVVVPVALLSAVALPFSQPLAAAGLAAADTLLSFAVSMLEVVAELPFSAVYVATPTLIETLLFYAVVVLLVTQAKDRRALSIVAAAALVLFLTDAAYWKAARIWDKELRVTFISVGQGEAAIVEFPSEGWGRSRVMVIDGGGVYGSGFDVGRQVVAPLLWKKKIKKIDYMVMSHPQRDHYGGLEFMARAFSPDRFFWGGGGGGARGRGLPSGLKETLGKVGAEVLVMGASSEQVDINGVKVEFLHPPADVKDRLVYGDGVNDNSLVVRLTYGEVSFLFTGDIEEGAEAAIVRKGGGKGGIRADVLKVPHHGSATSSSAAFLDAVGPSVAVMSVGWGNSFGFPSEEVLARYSAGAVRVLRTDLDGAVMVSTDGEEFYISTGRGR